MDVYDFLIRRMGSEGTTWVQRKDYGLENATQSVRRTHPGALIIKVELIT